MIIVSLKVEVPHDKRKEVIKTLRSIIGPTIAEPGCSDCKILQVVDKKNDFYIVQEWRNKIELEKYIRSIRFKKILALIEISFNPPEFFISTISKSEGIDYVESIRKIDEVY